MNELTTANIRLYINDRITEVKVVSVNREITALRWEQIDFKAKILQIIGRKKRFKIAKVVRYLELTPTMEEIVHERKKLNAFGDLFSAARETALQITTKFYACGRKQSA